MEGQRVPTRSVTPGAIVPRIPGSTRPSNAVVSARREVARPTPVIPPRRMEPRDSVSTTVTKRQSLPPVAVEAPKYRSSSQPTVTSQRSLRTSDLFTTAPSLGGRTQNYPTIPHRIPNRILLESDVR